MSLPQPDIRPIGPRVYVLAQPYEYAWTQSGVTKRIRVPAGYAYDGASVPRFAWTFSGLRPDGLIRAAALLHDWMYDHRGRPPPGSFQWRTRHPDADGGEQWQDIVAVWPRKEVDRLFARMLREASVGKRRRRWAYRAVRAFGGGW